MSQQSLRQASIRAVTSTTYTYEGDWHTLWDLLGIASGQFNERMLAYINNQLSTSYTELNGAMAAFAAEHGSTTFQAIGTFTPGFSLDAPVLAWPGADPTTDSTPNLEVTLTSPQLGDVSRIEWDDADPFVTAVSFNEHTVVQDDIDNLGYDIALGPFVNGNWSFIAYHKRGGSTSDASNEVSKEIDAPLPTLSSPVDAETGETTGSGSVSTDVADGTIYVVVTTSATPPSAAQVKLGQDNSSVAATFATSQAVTASGVNTISGGFTGLTGGTAYTAHYMHETVNGQSSVSSADGFTTDAVDVPTTWNPSDKSASITLSGGDLTATQTANDGAHHTLRSIGSKAAGKFYFELTTTNAQAPAQVLLGIGNASQTLDAPGYVGSSANSIGMMADAGQVYLNAANSGTAYAAYGSGDVVSVAVDVDAELIWWRVDGGNWNNNASNDPATGVGGFDFSSLNAGPWFAMWNCYTLSPADACTANFGATAYAHTPPSGFGNLNN